MFSRFLFFGFIAVEPKKDIKGYKWMPYFSWYFIILQRLNVNICIEIVLLLDFGLFYIDNKITKKTIAIEND